MNEAFWSIRDQKELREDWSLKSWGIGHLMSLKMSPKGKKSRSVQPFPSGPICTPPAATFSWSRVSSVLVIVLSEVVEVALREHNITDSQLTLIDLAHSCWRIELFCREMDQPFTRAPCFCLPKGHALKSYFWEIDESTIHSVFYIMTKWAFPYTDNR